MGSEFEPKIKTPTETPVTGIRRGHKRIAALATAVSLLAPGGEALASDIPAPAGGPKGQAGMSDEHNVTHWAYANLNSPLRGRPSVKAKTHGRLHFTAPDGTAEVYVVRSTWEDSKGHEWARIRVPDRDGSSSEEWVARSALGNFGVSHSAIRINRGKQQLTLYENGKPTLRAPVGVGRPGMETPAGNYWVQDKFRVTDSMDFRLNGMDIPSSVFGKAILMTTAKSGKNSDWPGGGTIGIHGTNQPELVPGRPSHGCVRLENKDDIYLFKHAPVGTPIKIV